MFFIAKIGGYFTGQKIECWAGFARTVYGRGVKEQSLASFGVA